MIRRAVLFLALFSSVANAFAISTIAGEEFYGTWSTASSALHPDRQILELSPVGGRWIQRDDLGNDKVLVLDASDISFNDDLLIIDYKKPEEVFRLKLVLGGWKVRDNKRIFGTVYMYHDEGKGLSLYNGLPMSFESGVDQIPPQAFWAFFSETGPKKVASGYINELEEALKEVEGVSMSEGPDTNDYALERISYAVSITKPEHSAHPSAIAIRRGPFGAAAIETAAMYESDEADFQEFYRGYLQELEKQKQETDRYMEELINKMEALGALSPLEASKAIEASKLSE